MHPAMIGQRRLAFSASFLQTHQATFGDEAPMNLAFYGTLRDPDVLRLAARQDLSRCYRGTKSVAGWACYFIAGEAYPMIIARAGASTLFSLYQNCPESAWEHLLDYEGDDYEWSHLPIRGDDYRVFMPRASLQTDFQTWNLERFQTLHKAAYLGTLH
jgi:hypothetical protein